MALENAARIQIQEIAWFVSKDARGHPASGKERMSTEKKNEGPEFELNKETSSELGPEELGDVAGGRFLPVQGGGGTTASCCVGCNTLDTVTSGCKNLR